MLINFDSSRSEMSRFYWKNWRQRSWKAHSLWFLIYFVVAAVIVAANKVLTPGLFAQIGAIGLFLIGVWIFFPLLFFTQAQRSLRVEKSGLTLSLGSRKKNIKWKQVTNFYVEKESFVFLLKGGSGILIPTRCFNNSDDVNSFRQDVAHLIDNPSVRLN